MHMTLYYNVHFLVSQKKARTFDFMEMFKEARQSAIDRNQGTMIQFSWTIFVKFSFL
jgi:hypothetical protein